MPARALPGRLYVAGFRSRPVQAPRHSDAQLGAQWWPVTLLPGGSGRMPVLVAFGSFVTTLLGGVAAVRIGDRRHLVLGLAAGLMLGVVLFDLLPEALGEQPGLLFGVPRVMLVTMAGFLTLHVIERAASVHRGHETEYAGHQHH